MKNLKFTIMSGAVHINVDICIEAHQGNKENMRQY